MKTISFDGDSYHLTVPTVDIVSRIREAGADGRLSLDRSWADAFFIQSEVSGDRTILESSATLPNQREADYELLRIRFGRASWSFFAAEMRYCFLRPMLIPLDKGGKEDFEAITGGWNGAILEGGSFFYGCYPSDNAIGPTPLANSADPWKSEVRFNTFDTRYYQFRDSTGNPEVTLRWMYWDGCLVCMRNLCLCRAKDLLREWVF